MTSRARKVPSGWRVERLRDVAEVGNGYGFPVHLQGRTDLPCPFVKVSDMNVEGSEVFIGSAANTVDGEILSLLGARTYPPGTVIFPKVGGALLTNKKRVLAVEASFDNNIMGVVSKEMDAQWLYYWLRTVDLGKLANVQALPSIRQSTIAALSIPLPPLEEQKRIVAVLNEKMSAIERARAAAEAQLEAAQALPAAYLREAFESAEAEKWPQKRLGDVLRQRREVVHPRDNPSGPATFVGLEHIESGTGVRIGADDIEMARLTGRKPRFHKNDIVYGYLRPYLNKVWVAEFGGLCSVDQYVYSVETDIADVEFVAWFMRSSTYMKRAPIGVTPGQLPRVRTDEVAGVKINLPPLAEQRRIVQKLDRQMASSRQVYDLVTDQLATLDGLSPAYLRQAFTGEI